MEHEHVYMEAEVVDGPDQIGDVLIVCAICGKRKPEPAPLPIHRTEAGYPNCSTCDGGGCLDCTDPA